MAHGQASERLRELQELMDADNQSMARDLEAGPSDTSPEPTPFRVSQSGGPPPSWKDRLAALKVYLPTEPRSWVIIAAATAASIVLLWLLFGADVGKKYIAPALPSRATSQPLTYSELVAQRPDNPCPEPWWFEQACLTSERSKSQTVHERCDAQFQEMQYTVEILDDCGLLRP